MVKIFKDRISTAQKDFKTFHDFLNFILLALESGDLKTLKILSTTFELPKLISSEQILNITLKLVQDDKHFKFIKHLIKEVGFNLRDLKSATNITLFAESCLYGSKKITRFFLQEKYNPNIQDIDGRTGLHKAVLVNNIDIVKLLINNKANLNIQDNYGLTALHIAAVKRFTDIKQLLLDSPQINKGLKVQGLAYNNKLLPYKVKLEEFTINKISENPYNLGVANYIKAIFGPENDDQSFIEAIRNLKIGLEKNLDKPELILTILTKILEIFQYNKSIELENYILEEAAKHHLHYINAHIFNTKCFEYLKIDAFKALDYGQKALNIIEKFDAPSNIKGTILFNLGLISKHVNNYKQSLEYINKAEQFLSNHSVLEEQFQLHLILKDLEKALAAAEKIAHLNQALDSSIKYVNNSILNKIYAYLTLSHESTEEILQKFNFDQLQNIYTDFSSPNDFESSENYITLLSIQSIIKYKAYDFTDAIKIKKVILNHIPVKETYFSHILIINQILELFRLADQTREALEFLKEIYQKFPEIMKTDNITLKHNEFIIYELNGQYSKATEILEKLNTSLPQKDYTKYNINFIRVVTEFNRQDFNKAREYLKLISVFENEEVKKIKLLMDFIEIQASNLNTGKLAVKKDISLGILFIEWLDNLGELDNFNIPSESIQAYFQQKKQALAKKKLILEDIPHVTSWVIGNRCYSTQDQEIIPIKTKKDYYTTIDKKIKLDPNNQKLFEIAINKGIATKEYKSIGIKFIPPLIELKTNGKWRLCTDTIFKNTHNKYLIIFDHEGNHNAIKKFASTAALNIAEVREELSQNNVDYHNSDKMHLGGDYKEL